MHYRTFYASQYDRCTLTLSFFLYSLHSAHRTQSILSSFIYILSQTYRHYPIFNYTIQNIMLPTTSTSSAKAVSFSDVSFVAIIPKADEASSCLWYTQEDFEIFKDALRSDTRRMRDIVHSCTDDRMLTQDDIDAINGIENLISKPSVARRMLTARRRHESTILTLSGRNLLSVEYLAMISVKSSQWARDRAFRLAEIR